MKLGILTFHCAHNYGAVLQCYGLQEYLQSLGHDVRVIDYRPKYLVNGYKRHSWRNWLCRNLKITLKKLKTEPKLYKIREKRYENFNTFINTFLKLYPYTKGTNFSEFDAIILGSDQIWEAPITGGKFDDVFFGQGASCKIISYAASNKALNLSTKEIVYYQSHLSKFSAIGVREKTLQSILQPIIEKKIELNIDPTLLAGSLLTKNFPNKRIHANRYVLVYEVIEHKSVIYAAKEYAKRINADVVILSAYLTYEEMSIRDQTASPEDFINYIKYAECVFTTSFHGTAISILCKTQFYSFRQHTNSDIRIESLLSILGLTDRFVEMDCSLSLPKTDYTIPHKRLEAWRCDSQNFLYYALNQ